MIAAFMLEYDPARYSVEDAAELVDWFCRIERFGAAGKTLSAARVAASDRPTASGHRSGADWLAAVTGQPLGQAVDELKLGASLAHQPELDAAYRGGQLSRPGAVLIAGAAEVNPNREKDLVDRAQKDTFRQLRERCLAARAEGQSPDDEARRAAALHRARRCRTWTDPDGAFRLDAALAPESGAALVAHLAAETNRHFEAARSAGMEEPREAYAADALLALVTGKGCLGPDSKGRADPKSRVTLRVDLAALRRGKIGSGEICEIPGVGPVSLATAREVLGEGLVDLVITDGVDITTMCRFGRSMPDVLRAAVRERDRTCAVPGCDQAVGLEIDHWQVPVSADGPTCLDNLVALCRFHHDQRTHRGFVLSGGPGHWVWTPPEGPRPRNRRAKATRRAKAARRSGTAPMGRFGSTTMLAIPMGPPRRSGPHTHRHRTADDPDSDPPVPPDRV